jgi:hypothetical protein
MKAVFYAGMFREGGRDVEGAKYIFEVMDVERGDEHRTYKVRMRDKYLEYVGLRVVSNDTGDTNIMKNSGSKTYGLERGKWVKRASCYKQPEYLEGGGRYPIMSNDRIREKYGVPSIYYYEIYNDNGLILKRGEWDKVRGVLPSYNGFTEVNV